MGLYDETKKFDEIKEGIYARFETTDNNVKVICTVKARQNEIEALIKSLVYSLAEDNEVSFLEIIKDISMEMLMDRELRRGGKK